MISNNPEEVKVLRNIRTGDRVSITYVDDDDYPPSRKKGTVITYQVRDGYPMEKILIRSLLKMEHLKDIQIILGDV